MIYEHGNVNLQSALNHLVDIGTQDPNKLMQYAQNPPAFLGNQAGLLINMAADMVGRKRQQAQTAPAPTATVKDQNMAKLAQSTQPGIGAINPMMAMQQQDMMQRAQPMEQPSPQMMAQGGLAELDTGDMFNEHNYAGGGIVAFDDGGEVRHYDGRDGSYVLPSDYDPEAMMADYAEAESNIPYTADDDVFNSKRKKAIKALQEKSKSPYDSAIDYYKSFAKPLIGPNPVATRPENVLGRERDKWFKSKPVMAPTVDVTADKTKDALKSLDDQLNTLDTRDKAAKQVSNKYNDDLSKTKENEIASYDKAMQRMTDLYKNDPYRKQLRDEYEKDKADSWYDVAGQLGNALLGAKKGQEYTALQQGFTGAQGVLKDLKKQKKDLLLAEQKADHEAMLAGAKYGFESEQYKAAIEAKYKIAEMGNAKDLQVAGIMSGSRDNQLNLQKTKTFLTSWDKWLAGPGMQLDMLAKSPLTGDKEHDAKVKNAQQLLATEKQKRMAMLGIQDPTISNVGSAADNSLISKYLTKTKPEED